MTLASGTLLHREVWNIQSFFGGMRAWDGFLHGDVLVLWCSC